MSGYEAPYCKYVEFLFAIQKDESSLQIFGYVLLTGTVLYRILTCAMGSDRWPSYGFGGILIEVSFTDVATPQILLKRSKGTRIGVV